MSANQRRALFRQNDNDFDCSIHFDVNEYLIENWPTLPERGRKSVWTLAQTDEEFDFSSIEEQVDDYVYVYAESSPTWSLPDDLEDEEDEEEDEEDDGWYLSVDLYEYYAENWPSLTSAQVDEAVTLAYYSETMDWQPIYNQLDAIVSELLSPKSPLPNAD